MAGVNRDPAPSDRLLRRSRPLGRRENGFYAGTERSGGGRSASTPPRAVPGASDRLLRRPGPFRPRGIGLYIGASRSGGSRSTSTSPEAAAAPSLTPLCGLADIVRPTCPRGVPFVRRPSILRAPRVVRALRERGVASTAVRPQHRAGPRRTPRAHRRTRRCCSRGGHALGHGHRGRQVALPVRR